MPNEYKILVYVSICTPTDIYIKGRVLKLKNHVPDVEDGPLHVIANSFMRFRSKELGYASLTIEIDGYNYDIEADDEGFFSMQRKRKDEISYQVYNISLENAPNEALTTGTFFYTLTSDKHGVITDIDDTILKTGVTSFLKLKVLVNSILTNPFKRKSIEGAAEFMSHVDSDGPYFYLSNSPWNIVDYLQAFLDHNDFPKGVVILRDIDFSLRSKPVQLTNKYNEIEIILSMHKDMRFDLIGDAAEKDIDIYTSISKEYPGRIRNIYIRLTGKARKDERAKKMAQDFPKVVLLESFEALMQTTKPSRT